MVVQDGGVAAVMASYNLVNGIKSTENQHTLTEVLRSCHGCFWQSLQQAGYARREPEAAQAAWLPRPVWAPQLWAP